MTTNVLRRTTSGIATKLLVRVARDTHAEVVRVERPEKTIVCFSTQVGCAIGCHFCTSGNDRFRRSLGALEMHALIQTALDDTPCDATRTVLLSAMGEGEPSLNAQSTLMAMAGFALRPNTRYALSTSAPTVSALDALYAELRKARLPVKLQLSVHAAPALRRLLMPHATVPLLTATDIVLAMARELSLPRPEFNIALMMGVNDHTGCARDLADVYAPFVRDVTFKINRFNPIDAMPMLVPSTEMRARTDARVLREHGHEVETYVTDGSDINAACGQLRHLHGENA